VVRAGAGYDTIDVAYCAKQGVYVANCPGKNSHAVAELTMGFILSIDRRMPEGVQLLRE
jgi:D-3-phosphoglycerate dehydrogenase